jgi:hypothetical protein
MNMILPPDFGPGRSNPLREFLRSRDAKRFSTQVALSDALSRATAQTARKHRMRNTEVLDGLITALVSCVQAMAPENEWADVGHILADEVQRRLTVTGVN